MWSVKLEEWRNGLRARRELLQKLYRNSRSRPPTIRALIQKKLDDEEAELTKKEKRRFARIRGERE